MFLFFAILIFVFDRILIANIYQLECVVDAIIIYTSVFITYLYFFLQIILLFNFNFKKLFCLILLLFFCDFFCNIEFEGDKRIYVHDKRMNNCYIFLYHPLHSCTPGRIRLQLVSSVQKIVIFQQKDKSIIKIIKKSMMTIILNKRQDMISFL